ncbi:MAG: YlxR family protein [Anaerolineales bacterium]
MSKKTVKRIKHVPQRTCVGCRTVMAKRQLVRVVRTANGVLVDPTGKLAGRGAYLHDRRSCWESGLAASLAHALKTELTAADRDRLEAFMNTLPQTEPGE